MSDMDRLTVWVHEAQRIVAFTGAGISTESGVPDYRSKGGIWDRFQPVTYDEFLASEEKRILYWERKREMFETMRHARPNEGHLALVKLEAMGKLLGIITQNIDGLHRMAGNSKEKILELHGTNHEIICLSCERVLPWEGVYERLQRGDQAPRCEVCGGFLKPHTISFGQALDPEVLKQAMGWARACDLLLAVGSTLLVEPAASIPRLAKEHGARFVIVTLSATPLDRFSDMKISSKAGEVLSRLVSRMEEVRHGG